MTSFTREICHWKDLGWRGGRGNLASLWECRKILKDSDSLHRKKGFQPTQVKVYLMNALSVGSRYRITRQPVKFVLTDLYKSSFVLEANSILYLLVNSSSVNFTYNSNCLFSKCCIFRTGMLLFLYLFRYQDDHNKAWFSTFSAMRWLGVRLDMICVIFVTLVVFFAIATQSGSGKSFFTS